MDTLNPQKQQQRYFNVIFIGLLYLKMHMNLLKLVMLVNEVGIYQEKMRFL